MLKNPENYQEAQTIIRNAVEDNLQTKRIRNAKMRSVIIVCVGIAVAIGFGIKQGSLVIGILSVLSAIVITAPFTLSYFLMRYTKRRILNGEYFRDNSADKIMDAARDYVKEYNKYEEKIKKKGK